jgi:hypothetical protein
LASPPTTVRATRTASSTAGKTRRSLPRSIP